MIYGVKRNTKLAIRVKPFSPIGEAPSLPQIHISVKAFVLPKLPSMDPRKPSGEVTEAYDQAAVAQDIRFFKIWSIANPDFYGLIWITTTLVFVISSLANCVVYLSSEKTTHSRDFWGYYRASATVAYSLAMVPLEFYFLLKYLGSKVGLFRFWCMWRYSVFISILSSLLLLTPVDSLRWTVTLATGTASAAFVGLNLKCHALATAMVVACASQFSLATVIKFVCFR